MLCPLSTTRKRDGDTKRGVVEERVAKRRFVFLDVKHQSDISVPTYSIYMYIYIYMRADAGVYSDRTALRVCIGP